MLQDWKILIVNWVNCYFNDEEKKEKIDIETLLDIISHLRENLNLDESKSSLLRAHTVKEFILEKYPQFKFENGTIEVSNEDEVYLVASLLLFFVCINSKEVDIKSAMCSRLSIDDQKTILKFSKCLMECTSVTCKDVEAAILEACIEDASTTSLSQVNVAETPPVLRSLHSEVRRLQAALDAERFDRNYLQEELARTNLKMEKLMQDKDQYKLEIMDLKAKLSLCKQDDKSYCTEEDVDRSAKLMKQLKDVEDRLEQSQGLLDDVSYERDIYKNKIEELKKDRDKWLSLSQQESDRMLQLSQELEIERRNAQTLKEVVAELQQHNRLNGLDSSQLECDDPDASIQSFQHNSSVCSEVCANVVEVQLGEERAKIVLFKQQIEVLQRQINDLITKAALERQSYESKLNEKESEVNDLKHCINEKVEEINNLKCLIQKEVDEKNTLKINIKEEVNEKNTMKEYFNDEVMKLNNEVNELEQRLKENAENSRKIIESKFSEIEILQKEKISLLESFNNDKSKLENIIVDLKLELDNEMQAKNSMRDSYENKIMKLNDKVVKRNNELVELQNNVCEKSEVIETLHLELRKEKDSKQELILKYDNDMKQLNVEKDLIQKELIHKTVKLEQLTLEINEKEELYAKLEIDIENFKADITELKESCENFKALNSNLQHDNETYNRKLDEMNLELNNLNKIYSNEKEQFLQNLGEKTARIDALQMQLQNEIEFKICLQNDMEMMERKQSTLNEELTGSRNLLKEKETALKLMETYLNKERNEREIINNDLAKISNEMKVLKTDHEVHINSFNEQMNEKSTLIEDLNNRILESIQEKYNYEEKIKCLVADKETFEKELAQKSDHVTQLQAECNNLIQETENNKLAIEILEQNVQVQIQKCMKLENIFDEETSKIIAKLNETEKVINELCANSKKAINSKEKQVQALYNQIDQLEKNIKADRTTLMELSEERDKLKLLLEEEIFLKTSIEREYQEKCMSYEVTVKSNYNEITELKKIKAELTSNLEHETKCKNKLEKEYNNVNLLLNQLENEKDELTQNLQQYIKNKETIERELHNLTDLNENTKKELECAYKIVDEKSEGIKKLEEEFALETAKTNELMSKERTELQLKISNLQSQIKKIEQMLKKETDCNKIIIETLQKDNEQLLFTMEEKNSNHELLIKEKDRLIETLETKVKEVVVELESLRQCYEESTLLWEKFKLEAKTDLDVKEEEIRNVKEHNMNLEKLNIDLSHQVKQLDTEIIKHRNEITSLAKEFKDKNTNIITKLIADLNEEQAIKDALITEKDELLETNNKLVNEIAVLTNSKDILTQELTEERNVRNIIIEEKNCLKNELNNEVAAKRALFHEKECLAQQLVEEKSMRELVENEKSNLLVDKNFLQQKLNITQQKVEQLFEDSSKKYKELVDEKNVLIEKLALMTKEINLYEKEFSNEKSLRHGLKSEKDELENELGVVKEFSEEVLKEKDNLLKQVALKEQKVKDLMKENEKLIASKEILLNEKEKLANELATKQELLKEKSNIENIIETTITEKNNILAEKEQLLKDYDLEKCAKEDIKCEKNKLIEEIKELNANYVLEISNKNEEMVRLEENLKHECDTNLQIMSSLGIVFARVSNLSKELNNDALQKLINSENCDTIEEKLDLLSSIVAILSNEVLIKAELEKSLEDENSVLSNMKNIVENNELQIFQLKTEVNHLQQTLQEAKLELSKQSENYVSSMNAKLKDIHTLQEENQTLHNDLNDVKLQLERKVHSLKEKLMDNENVTDKLKQSYDCQIENLNVMITKLTSYLKDKTAELECLRKEKEQLAANIEESNKVIKSLEEAVNTEKQKQEKYISDFESERLVLKNMVTVTESVMEDQKMSLNNIITEHLQTIEVLQEEIKNLKEVADNDKLILEDKMKEKDFAITSLLKELSDVKEEKNKLINVMKIEKEELNNKIKQLTDKLLETEGTMQQLIVEKCDLEVLVKKLEDENYTVQHFNDELNSEEVELRKLVENLNNDLQENVKVKSNLELTLKEQIQHNEELLDKVKTIEKEVDFLKEVNKNTENEKNKVLAELSEVKDVNNQNCEEIDKLRKENVSMVNIVEENKKVINNLEQLIKHELEQNQKLRDESSDEKVTLTNKFIILQEYRKKAEEELNEREKEINSLRKEIDNLKDKVNVCEKDIIAKDGCISLMTKEKDAIISAISKDLVDERNAREKIQQELEIKTATIYKLQEDIGYLNREKDVMRREYELKATQERETLLCQERRSHQKYSSQVEKDRIQVDKDSSSDITHSSSESLKTITDLEKIIHDKNRTITTLQSDITYLKSIMAESETKLLDVCKELEVSKENCHQLSNQLKKIVFQKNEEIAELKKQVNKTENRASQIIKVSAKYQAIILKRIAEIKSNTVLKELNNYGNTNTCDGELRKSLNAGLITMEDLENFLETTDRHLKRCTEKQISLQKERDRLYEVNRINESEIINMKKFLTELSVSLQTFNSMKDLYTQKLSKVVSIQRTVRREILNLDGLVTDACMCKLERGYAAVMQDLSECAMNLERWVERCVSRAVSIEKIKQAFSENERMSIPGSFQNAGLEVQLEELEKSFQRLLEEVGRAQKGEGAKDTQSVTVMEVKAEYEDKLNRMKAKMKQLFNEQMSVIKEKQRDEIAILEQELDKARETLAKTSKNYEEHIRKLTTELWTVGEKFLMTKDEAEWLKRKQKSGSLMSLQHVHSSGLVPVAAEPRPSDSMSLRSLPINNNETKAKEARGLHMSDEEGEVFDNRWLKELSSTPRRGREPPPGQRISELKWRNSLCPPHLKSSYPAETQFAPALDEEDIKCLGTNQGKPQRKEVGITAYKKPGPPTPSKQAGRLSATDSELRESLRVESDPHASRKTGTPSRLRSLFRSSKTETAEGTPRSRRLSNIFRKK